MKQEWVSVEDRLPEHEKEVLFYSYGDYFAGFYCHCEKEWYFGSEKNPHEYSRTPITHWMPLPEPPKEGG